MGAEHSGHVSKSQRRYKVRFQSDIRRSKRIGSSIPANTEPAPVAVRPTQTQTQIQKQRQKKPSHGHDPPPIDERATPAVNKDEDEDEDAGAEQPDAPFQCLQDNSGDQPAAAGDASLVFVSPKERHDESGQPHPDDYSSTLDSFCIHPNGISHVGYLDDGGLMREHDEALPSAMFLAQSPESQSHHHLSPQLSFQADILPKIPREIPYPSLWSGMRRSERRLNLQYYIEKVVPQLMPLWNAADNPFLCIIVPAAAESDILMHAIMALSFYHRSLQSRLLPDSSREYGRNEDNDAVKALWHKQKILTLLQGKLTKPDFVTDDATLAACMLMQTFEVLFSGTSGWDHWLKGATLFIQLRGKLESDLKDSNSWVRLVKCVVAVETFAATSTRFDLLISEQYWNIYRRLRQDSLQKMAMGQLSSLNESSDDEHFEKLVGCPVVVVYSLGRMVMLMQSREETEDPSRGSRFHDEDSKWYSTWSIEAIKLEDLLFRWQPKDTKLEKTHLAEAFRQAALVYYYRNIRRLEYNHQTVQYHVRRTFDHLGAIAPSSDIEGIALWPTMIAAIEIDETKNPELTHRAIKHLRGISKHMGDPLHQNTENALKLLWSRRRDAESWEKRMAVDWNELSREMDWKWCWV
ncbi:hypothetical protein A1O3_01826 [Capronia epimyces CBS 606.96]|uniref:Fungal-specific transcription factor domain-containing protein n=1 Tax=Capronia epimyces CBS 606.96 TaxID=1182542 RepID=W9Y7E0_9EURO|nr:uncharacterized protein A1O3_01826 [Capronia epimyces CBS 606.96]EXJ88762.1 hypothetical protein A1O3_01826 [Capronia epimyces CBS 606.96]